MLLQKDARFILMKVTNEQCMDWILLLLYGHSELRKMKETWDMLGGVLGELNLSILVLGDFNQILSWEDKLSRRPGSSLGMDWLGDFVY